MLDLIRMSMLRNVPVIFGDRQIGLFQNICLDKARKRVYALIVSGGIHGKQMVLAQQVRSITSSFILIGGCSRFRQLDKMHTSPFVRDTSGLLVGRIFDYAIDEETLDIMGIEIISGYLPREYRKRIWMFAYSFDEIGDELSIPMLLNSEPCFSEEGNDACGYLR